MEIQWRSESGFEVAYPRIGRLMPQRS